MRVTPVHGSDKQGKCHTKILIYLNHVPATMDWSPSFYRCVIEFCNGVPKRAIGPLVIF